MRQGRERHQEQNLRLHSGEQAAGALGGEGGETNTAVLTTGRVPAEYEGVPGKSTRLFHERTICVACEQD